MIRSVKGSKGNCLRFLTERKEWREIRPLQADPVSRDRSTDTQVVSLTLSDTLFPGCRKGE